MSIERIVEKNQDENGINKDTVNILINIEKICDITEYIKEQKEEQMKLYEDLKYVLYAERFLQELQLIIQIITSGMKLYSVVTLAIN